MVIKNPIKETIKVKSMKKYVNRSYQQKDFQ